jgi:hypothetical protein
MKRKKEHAPPKKERMAVKKNQKESGVQLSA